MINNVDINSLMTLLSMGNNPETIVKNFVSNNPQANAILQQAQQSGLSMKDFTMQYAKEKGINIQPIIDMMSKKGIK